MWEQSGWMHKQDPYGWFMWYCRYVSVLTRIISSSHIAFLIAPVTPVESIKRRHLWYDSIANWDDLIDSCCINYVSLYFIT